MDFYFLPWYAWWTHLILNVLNPNPNGLILACRRSAPTQSLQKHLAAGKPVALAAARAGAGACAAPPSPAITHLLLQRGGETFLHELCPLVRTPTCSEEQ